MKLPTKQECYSLLKKYRTPDNVIKHSEAVATVGLRIAQAMIDKGIKVNIAAVESACLLHDIARPTDFSDFTRFTKNTADFYQKLKEKHGKDHKVSSARIVEEEGYAELGEIMRKHGFMSIGEPDGPKTWEEKIVNYSDKRVMHDRVVSLKERFADLHKRYSKKNIPDYNGKLRESKENLMFELEKEMFEGLGIKPKEIR